MTQDQRLLRRYLSQYIGARRNRDGLRRRLDEIRADFATSPFHSHDDTGSGPKGGESSVPAYVTKLLEVEARLERAYKELTETMNKIVAMIGLLEESSPEYAAMSMRYIDGFPEEEILDRIPCSRRTYFRLIDAAIDQLLDYEGVQNTISAYAIKLSNIPGFDKVGIE